MGLVVFQTIQVLVSFVTDITFVGLLLLHADRTRVWLVVVRIQNRKCAIAVLLQSLVLVSVGFVVFEAVSVTIRFV